MKRLWMSGGGVGGGGVCVGGGEVGGSPYNGLYEEVPPKRGTFFRCVKGHGFHQLKYMKA